PASRAARHCQHVRQRAELSYPSRVSCTAASLRGPPAARRHRPAGEHGERDQEYLREIMPRYSDMAPYYDEMLARFEQWDPDFDVNVGNLPYCTLPKWGSRIHHGGQETVTKSADAVGLEEAMNKYEWHGSLRTYL